MPIAILILVFLSGVAGLMYEVLWMNQLGHLFGSGAYASSATLAAFFLGLGAGSAWWGRQSRHMQNPAAGYAMLEAGVFIGALLYFPILLLLRHLYPALLSFGDRLYLGLLVKFLLAVLLVCPAAVFMGGTIPVIGQLLIRENHRFGRTASLIYCVNTLGAALGALLAGFQLPPLVGYKTTYGIALAITASVALAARLLARGRNIPARPAKADRKKGAAAVRETGPAAAAPGMPLLGRGPVLALCFISGFGTLSLEVLWTQMLAHVYQNTVYTFATILVVTLVCMALGAGAAHGLARRGLPPVTVMLPLLMATGLAVGLSSFHLMWATDSLRMIASHGTWGDYVRSVFVLTFKVTGPPLFLLGVLFPYLLKVNEPHVTSAGKSLGNLAAVNTAGAILGPLLTGFLLLKWVGLWYAIYAFALLYPLLAVCFPSPLATVGVAWRGAAMALCVLLAIVLHPGGLLLMRVEPGERIVDHWSSPNGTVAVVQKGADRNIVIDGHYGLGGTAAAALEQDQTILPLLLHPAAKSMFFLGVGTGITAGEAVAPAHGLERIVACELAPEVATAAKQYFSEYTAGLFRDARATVVTDDGRHFLAATRECFDIINADLFVVYNKGAGDLYTLEHFRSAAKRLKPGGIFVQWIPLYQLTQPEFHIIARTMVEAFPQVTVWRNHFRPWQDSIALVGQNDSRPLCVPGYSGVGADKRQAVMRGIKDNKLRPDGNSLMLFYCGNLSGAKSLFHDSPLNTEDHPVIEYLTPRSASLQAADKVVWFAGPQFVGFMEKMQSLTPPETDPALAGLPVTERKAAKAGLFLARSYLLGSAYQRKVPGANESWLRQAELDYRQAMACWLEEAPAKP